MLKAIALNIVRNIWKHYKNNNKSLCNTEKGFVYFMYDPDTGHIKIGKAKDPDRRLKTFQTANPNIEILNTIQGYTKLEHELHERFSNSRIHQNREWFYPDDSLLDYIRNTRHKILQRDNTPKRTIFGRFVGWWNFQLSDLGFWAVIAGFIVLSGIAWIWYG